MFYAQEQHDNNETNTKILITKWIQRTKITVTFTEINKTGTVRVDHR